MAVVYAIYVAAVLLILPALTGCSAEHAAWRAGASPAPAARKVGADTDPEMGVRGCNDLGMNCTGATVLCSARRRHQDVNAGSHAAMSKTTAAQGSISEVTRP